MQKMQALQSQKLDRLESKIKNITEARNAAIASLLKAMAHSMSGMKKIVNVVPRKIYKKMLYNWRINGINF